MVESNTCTLPKVTQLELHIILAGLDELPAKVSRRLHQKITEHVEAWISAQAASSIGEIHSGNSQ